MGDRKWANCCRFLQLTEEGEWKENCIYLENKSPMAWFRGCEEVHAEPPPWVRSQVYVRLKKMSLLHKAMTEILRPVLSLGRTKFEVKREENVGKNCYSIVILYCCDIPEGKNLTCVKHSTAVKRTCPICLATIVDIGNVLGREGRMIK